MLNHSVPILPFALTPLRHAVALALCGAVAWSAMPAPALAQAASAQAPAQQRAYRIAAGPLAPALHTLASEAGVALMFTPAQTDGKTTAGLNGSYTLAQAYATLLAGSGLQAVLLENGSYVLRAAPPAAPASHASAPAATAAPATLATVNVRARRAVDGSTEGTGSYTSRVTSIASKGDQAFREVPQSVSVITRQQIDDQHLVDINEALNLTPGITVKRTNSWSSNFYSRGFQIDAMQIDGGAPLNIGSYTYGVTQDMAMFDRVEVMRGASGLLGGAGDPGGIINLARKKPLPEAQLVASASAGRWDNYRVEVDGSAPLAYDGKLRGRAVAMHVDADSHLRYTSVEKTLLYGVLELDLPTGSLLTLGGSSQNTRQNGGGAGLPTYSDGGDLGLPRNTSLAPPGSYSDMDVRDVFLQFEHRFANHWKLKLNASHQGYFGDFRGGFAYGAVTPGTTSGSLWGGTAVTSFNKQDVIDLNLAGPFKLFGRTHELLLGADRQKVNSRWQSTPLPGSFTTPINPFDQDATPWDPVPVRSAWELYGPWGQKQSGAYGTLRLHPTDQLHVVLGARAARYKFDQLVQTDMDGTGWVVDSASKFDEPTKITPYGGLIYDLNAQWSAYVSYSSIFKPQGLSKAGPAPGTSLKPITGKSYEGGLKGELLDGKLNATLGVFQVERNGAAILDPRYAAEWNPFSGSCCYLPQGRVTSRGVDMEIGGEIASDWQASVGYTFNTSRNESTNLPYSSITPKHLFKLSTAYTLPGGAFKVGGNATLQSAHYVSGTVVDRSGVSQAFDFSQGGYAVFNALLSYQIDPKWSVALNVNNVFDKVYYEKLGYSTGGNWYGTPRNATLTVRAAF